jgi:hypothetical protein
MDAAAVMPRPSPPTQPRNSVREPDAPADEFEAHMPRDEDTTRAAQTTDPREPAQNMRADNASPQTDDPVSDATVEQAAPEDISLAAPMAPVVVRPQNSVVTFDLSALVALPAIAPGPEAPAQPKGAQPTQPIAPQGEPSAPPEGAQAPADADGAAMTQSNAPASPIQTKTAEIVALPGALPLHAERPLPKLRAGRDAAGAEATTADKPVAALAVAGSGVAANKPAARPETPAAVQAATAPTAVKDKAPETAPAADAAPAEHRAHRINETAGPQGHRPTTPAALVAQQIIRRFDGKSTSINVRLDPPELGRVQVKLEVGADNRVSAVVAAENPATLSDLVRSARELERALQEAGLDLTGGGLSFDLADRGDKTSNDGASDTAHSGAGARHDAAARENTPVLASRPFGLESWRGARIDVMV